MVDFQDAIRLARSTVETLEAFQGELDRTRGGEDLDDWNLGDLYREAKSFLREAGAA